MDLAERPQLEGIAHDATVLLAQGLIRLFDAVTVRGHIVRQNDATVPSELHRAMGRLGRLRIEAGLPDNCASVYDVVSRSREPMRSPAWGIPQFVAPTFPFGDVVLVDPDLRVPTEECFEIASSAPGGEDNVVEARLHALLRETARRAGRNPEAAYTALRELLARESLISDAELIDWIRENGFTGVQADILQFYARVPDAWLHDGKVHRCRYCRTLLRPHADRRAYPEGACPIRQCAAKHTATVGERIDPERMLVAQPQVLSFWTGPGIDELAIYDTARTLGLDTVLYPRGDACDVSINGDEIGIDAKSYQSPVTLALRLNRGIGGLEGFNRRIIAVGDELARGNPQYLSTLRSMIHRPDDTVRLEVMTVSQVLSLVREVASAYAS